jgi:hypothetical protein
VLLYRCKTYSYAIAIAAEQINDRFVFAIEEGYAVQTFQSANFAEAVFNLLAYCFKALYSVTRNPLSTAAVSGAMAL